MPNISRLENVVLDLLEQSQKNFKVAPVNLGGISGPGGGVGAPPGGFIGKLLQTYVVYDEDEAQSSFTPASGMSLLDNLNHIRYRLGVLESGGSITIVDDNTSTTYYDVTAVHFSGVGVSVVDLGGGQNKVIISGGTGGGGIAEAPIDGNVYGRQNAGWLNTDTRYLKLNASNDPVTGQIYIENPDPSYAVSIYTDTGGNGGGGLEIISLENDAVMYVESDAAGVILDAEQFGNGVNSVRPVIAMYRSPGSTENLSGYMLLGSEDTGAGTITGGFLKYIRDSVEKFRVDNDGKAYTAGELLITEAPIDGLTYGRKDGGWVLTSGGSGTGDGSFMRVKTADFTLASGYSVVTVDYVDMNDYTLTLNGDAVIEVLEGNTASAGGVTNGDSHDHIGGDGASIAEGAFAFTDVTTANATSLKHGLLPKLSGTATEFLGGDGAFHAVAPDRTKALQMVTDFLEYGLAISGGYQFGEWVLNNISNGSMTTHSMASNHPGIVEISCGTSANSGAYIAPSQNGIKELNSSNFEIIFYVKQSTNLVARLGPTDSISQTAPTNGVWVDVAATTLTGKAASGGSTSTTGTNYTLSTDTWYRCKIVVNSGASSVTYYLYNESGTQLWTDTVSSNIPTTATLPPNKALALKTTSSGGATGIMYLDWLAYWSTATLTR